MNLKEFVNPGKACRPLPVWSWNNVIEAAEIETRVREMKRKGFGGFFIQAGTGLRTAFLEDEWMRVVRRAVETAREAELECWLTDEDRGPAGFAGGKTLGGSTDLSASVLVWFKDATSLDEETLNDAIAFTVTSPDGITATVVEKPADLKDVGAFFAYQCDSPDPRFDNGCYPDLLDYDVTTEFINAVHERYSKLFRYDFGVYMPGIFTCAPTIRRTKDFPERGNDGDSFFPWSGKFVEWFKGTHGYSPLENLHHLLNDSEEGFQFRHDYWLAVTEMFLASYTIQISTWCREHDFKFTGRIPGEESLAGMTANAGCLLSHYEYMDIPGVEYTGRTLDRPWIPRQAASVAAQLDRKRVLGVLFGGAGNDLTFQEMKRIADFNFALGITNIAPKAVQYSLKGERKRDYPPSISYHQPYWENLRVITDYLARCSWAVGEGEGTATVLVMVPNGSVMGYTGTDPASSGSAAGKISSSYESIVRSLVENHIPFDLGDERIVRRHGTVDGDTFSVGKADYSVVVLPPAATWRTSTTELLASFEGRVIIMGDVPTKVEGVFDDSLVKYAEKDNVTVLKDDPGTLVESLGTLIEKKVVITGMNGEAVSDILVNHRVESGAHILFIANTNPDESREVTITVKALGGVVELDALTGRAFRYASDIRDDETVIATTLYPSGSRIFLVDQTQTSLILDQPESSEEQLIISGPYKFKRNQDNSLTIDTCTLTMDGRTVLKNAPLTAVKKAIWERTGIDEYFGSQPWVMEQRNVRTRTNKTELSFSFTVEAIPETIALAMESADKFTITINGTKVEPTAGKWYFDKRIPVIDLDKYIVEGENTIVAKTDYLWDTEIEDIYIFGDFAVGSEEDGFPIHTEPETLSEGSWTDQGYPFYAGTMSYTMEFDIDFTESEFFEIDLSGGKGSNFFLTVNGTQIGSLPFSPFRAEITGALQQGKNEIEIEVAGTLGNALGPFHIAEDGKSGLVGPEVFGEKNSGGYSFTPYGFIKPPVLVRVTETAAEEAE